MKTKNSEKKTNYLKKMANEKGIPGCKLLRKKARKLLRAEVEEAMPEPPPTKEEKAAMLRLLEEMNKNQDKP